MCGSEWLASVFSAVFFCYHYAEFFTHKWLWGMPTVEAKNARWRGGAKPGKRIGLDEDTET